VFDAPSQHQVGVDAVLTNGGDVTVNEPATASTGPDLARQIASVPGVANVEPVQHRFAYVGTDLQDLYGVDPATVVGAAQLQNAYFQGGSARGLMQQLARHPDNLIVSAETVHDFQLRPGDLITLRLLDHRTGGYRPVPFHYVAVGKEFPTAPRDSFLIANRDYIAARTHNPAVSLFLVDTSGRSPARVADDLRRQLGPGATVSDIEHTRRVVASSLTAVDLAGLTRVELGFALVLGAAATGLVLWLGFAERRRSFAILNALGARPRQLGAFVWSEAAYVLGAGLAVGAALGALLCHVLVRILTGVFDPPPASLSIPWAYLLTAIAVGALAVVLASALALRAAATPRLSALRED
jgi:putative ABC transport system permease protein